MTGALLYQPRQRWRVGVAFGAAALIHLTAVVIAGIDRNAQMKPLPSGQDEFTIVDLIDPSPPIDGPTPPPEVVESPPSPHTSDESFIDEGPIAPPVHRQNEKRVPPIMNMRNTGIAGSLNLSAARVLALHAPRPEYPYEARRQRITGSGIVAMTVDPASGRVTEASMFQSTGNPYLDNAAITGFRRWRFKPGTASRIKSPITYTLTGAAY